MLRQEELYHQEEQQATRNRCDYKHVCPIRYLNDMYCGRWENPYNCVEFKKNREFEQVVGKTIDQIVNGNEPTSVFFKVQNDSDAN